MKKDKQRGSITVEAALFLPIFLFAFLSIYNMVYFARAQLVIQYSVDQAAKEVAQYSYLLDKIGILESLDSLSSRSQEFEDNIQNIMGNLDTIQGAAQNAVDGQDIIQNGIDAGNAFQDTYDTVKGYVQNPKDFLNGILGVMKKDAVNGISKYMVSVVAKSCVNNQLSIAGGNADAEKYLRSMGVTSGLRFDSSAWCENGSRDIRIVVDYEIANSIPFFKLGPWHYRVCASTRVWSGVS
ncbi:pilus assembly protein [Blautia schinkii]|nr:pilus assembly protein [Blautia schinkii]